MKAAGRMLRACLLLGVSGAAMGVDEFLLKEPYPDQLHSTHVVLITVPLCVLVLAILCMAIMAWRSTVRLTALLALVVWVLLVCVGVVSWSVTYVASRDDILMQAEHSAVSSAALAKQSVRHDLGVAITMLDLLCQSAAQGVFNVSGIFPEQQEFIHRLIRTVGTQMISLTAVSVTSLSGAWSSLQLHTVTPDGTQVQRHWVTDGGNHPPWAKCTAKDWQDDCVNISTPSACNDLSSVAARKCAVSCGFPAKDSRNCLGFHTVVFTTVLAADRDPADTFQTYGIFAEPMAGYNVVFTLPSRPDPPWLPLTYSKEATFSEPSVNPNNKLVVLALQGIYNDQGVRLGHSTVFILLSAMNDFMKELKPSPNGISLLLTAGASVHLVGASLSLTELKRDASGPEGDREGMELVLVDTFQTESRVLHVANAVKARWGGAMQGALSGSALYQEAGDVIMSFPVDIPNFPLVIVVDIPMSDVLGKADEASKVALALAVSISIGLALLAAAGLAALLRPLQMLQKDMYAAATMHVDNRQSKATSRVREVRLMQESFSVLVRQLAEYKQYLPQSVLLTNEDHTESDGMSHAPTVSGSSRDRESRSSSTSSSGAVKVHAAHMSVGPLKMRNVTLMVTNLHGIIPESQVVCGLEQMHASYVEQAVLQVKSNYGIVDEFIGDKVHVSFNTLRYSPMHRTNATACMVALKGRLSCTLPSFHMNAAISSSRALCGNMGCQGLKRYSIIGKCAALIWVFERWGRAWDIAQVADQEVVKEVQGEFEARKLAKVQLTDTTERFVYEVLQQKAVDQEEWMYQIENSRDNLFDSYNLAIDALYEGNYDNAAAYVRFAGAGTHVARVARMLKVCTDRGAPLQPIPANYAPHVLMDFSRDPGG